jgi:hypothetical protein
LDNRLGFVGVGARESACELSILGEVLVIIASSPEKVSAHDHGFLLVSISKRGRDLLGFNIFVVSDIDLVLGPVTIWVHHIDEERCEAYIRRSLIHHHLRLGEGLDSSGVLIFDFVYLGADACGALHGLILLVLDYHN